MQLRVGEAQCCVVCELFCFGVLQEDWRQKRGFKHFSIVRKLDGHPFPAGKRSWNQQSSAVPTMMMSCLT